MFLGRCVIVEKRETLYFQLHSVPEEVLNPLISKIRDTYFYVAMGCDNHPLNSGLGAFNNYLDRFLDIFDHPPTSCRQTK